jgi:hypothetical protein
MLLAPSNEGSHRRAKLSVEQVQQERQRADLFMTYRLADERGCRFRRGNPAQGSQENGRRTREMRRAMSEKLREKATSRAFEIL